MSAKRPTAARTLGAVALLCGLGLWGVTGVVQAHPAPWSYVDLRIAGDAVDAQFTIHVFDLAHDLNVAEAGSLLSSEVIAAYADRIVALLGPRVTLRLNGEVSAAEWGSLTPSGEGDSIRVHVRYRATRPVEHVSVSAALFPYDPLHQTFVNIYENGALARQEILEAGRTECQFATGVDPGAFAVVRRFVASGIHHILIGPDHLLFLVGLLLLGGSWTRLLLVVSAFTVAHSITLSLAALQILNVPASVTEPAIALSIVYVGIDNLLVRGGRDARTWIAFGFGLIHGFGFANVLREMALPREALIWSLASFNVGVEIGQLAVVLMVAAALGAIRRRSERASRQIATAGSVAVAAAGAYWFVERVFGL